MTAFHIVIIAKEERKFSFSLDYSVLAPRNFWKSLSELPRNCNLLFDSVSFESSLYCKRRKIIWRQIVIICKAYSVLKLWQGSRGTD